MDIAVTIGAAGAGNKATHRLYLSTFGTIS
jgi:hypothetical protein